MPIEPFDTTDENGVRVTGTAEAYRDGHGPFYDPSSEFYQNPRYSDHAIDYLNTRDVCRINPDVLGQAVQKAFQSALVRLGIDDPKGPAVKLDVEKWIAETLRHCALHPDKYVSSESAPSVDSQARGPADDQSTRTPAPRSQPVRFAATPALPLEALLSADRARALDDWAASSAPGRPIDRKVSAPAPVRYLSSYRVRS